MVEWEDREIIYVGKCENKIMKNPYILLHNVPFSKINLVDSYSLIELAAYIQGATIFRHLDVAVQNGIPKDICSEFPIIKSKGVIRKLDEETFNELFNCRGLYSKREQMDIRK